MITSKNLLKQLKDKGYRLTKVRESLIDLFSQGNHALSVEEILQHLGKKNLYPNKTTIYRELEFLKDEGIVLEILLGEDKKRYESAYGDHHHHLVCIRCDRIADIALDNELRKEEQRITQQKQFTVLNHSLEFFGLCARCQ